MSTDHNKITLAIKYLRMSQVVNGQVTIAKLVFFVAVRRFHYQVKNK